MFSITTGAVVHSFSVPLLEQRSGRDLAITDHGEVLVCSAEKANAIQVLFVCVCGGGSLALSLFALVLN